MDKNKLSDVQNLTDHLSEIIVLVDSKLAILDANPTFRDIFPKINSLEKLLSTVDSVFLKREADDIDEKERRFFELSLKKDGNIIWMHGCISKVSEDLFILSGHDITTFKKSELELLSKNTELENIKTAVLNLLEDMTETQESLKLANKELRQLDEMKNEFISIASHELRTPMTSIKGYVSMILDGDAGEISPESREYLEEVYQSNERLVSLVNDMLDVSRIEQKRLQFDIKAVKIMPVIKEAIERMIPMAIDDRDELLLETDIEKEQKVSADPQRIQQVLHNLVENAIKFTEKGKIIVTVNKIDGFVEISVKDNGIGIPKSEIPKLFNKFYQVSHVLNRPKSGSGLGLYISKSIVEGMGGKIKVESKERKGSVFTFTIPLAK